MAKAEIQPGPCGYTTNVEATKNGKTVKIDIQSRCPAIQKMAAELTEVAPFNEISFRRGMPQIIEKGMQYCTHAACPVPVGIIKTVEVEAGLNLPMDVSIKISK